MKERRKRRKEREKRQTCRCHAIWARRCAFGVPLPVAPGNVARRELAVSALPTSAAALRFVSHGRASPCPRLSRFPSTPVLRTTAKIDYFFLSYELRVLLETRRRLLVSQTVLDNKSVVHIAHLNSEINFNETISSYLQSIVRHETKDWLLRLDNAKNANVLVPIRCLNNRGKNVKNEKSRHCPWKRDTFVLARMIAIEGVLVVETLPALHICREEIENMCVRTWDSGITSKTRVITTHCKHTVLRVHCSYKCMPLKRLTLFKMTRFKQTCFMQPTWCLAYDSFGVRIFISFR